MGDIHGHYEDMTRILRTAGLIDGDCRWTGADATLCFLGDYVDRGPDGIGVIDLVMRLQHEAPAAGGQVIGLLGNHEVMLLGAYRFGSRASHGQAGNFFEDWIQMGGVIHDLDRLTADHVDWLLNLPAMARVDQYLLIHADSRLYIRYGDQVETVNRVIGRILASDETLRYERLMDEFTERMVFTNRSLFGISLRNGENAAVQFLATFGGERIVHGHTPITYVTDEPPDDITEPLVYANGLCINVDHGLYRGGRGFITRLTP